jgi:phosphoribosylformimino-5-aminoimidazole carboxamide ribotide isomerase
MSRDFSAVLVMTPPACRRLDLPPLLPVIDILGGRVVWGIAGKRQSYQPLDSPLVDGARPAEVARALRELVQHDWLYLADLDAIEQDAPDWQTLEHLAADGCRLMVDAGLRDAARARWLMEAGATAVVAALETLAGPAVLNEIVAEIGGERTIFSLDLRGGEVVGNTQPWGGPDPLEVARRAIAAGIGGMIVLDVAGVGVEQGVPTAGLCRQVRAEVADLSLITGGGVRGIGDVRELLAGGVDSVLVASALHRGQIGRHAIARLHR